jgi:hypothetical protein
LHHYALPYLLAAKGSVVGISLWPVQGIAGRAGIRLKFAMMVFETLRTENLKTGLHVLIPPWFTPPMFEKPHLLQRG